MKLNNQWGPYQFCKTYLLLQEQERAWRIIFLIVVGATECRPKEKFMIEMNVCQVAIPKLKGKYFTDLRTVTLSSDTDERVSVDCLDGGNGLSVGDKAFVDIKSMRECSPTSLRKENWDDYSDSYLCVSESRESKYAKNYEFYKPSVNGDSETYSIMFVTTFDNKFTVGEEYVLCYRKVTE